MRDFTRNINPIELTTDVTTVVPWLITVPEKVRRSIQEQFFFVFTFRKMAGRPLVLPETFSGEEEWSQWICHFESIAAVNEWDGSKKLLWLKARLTGRAQLALQHLPEEVQADYARLIKAMKDRFEPESRKGRYQAEFQARRKKASEGWANFAQDLQILVDKAFPHLQGEAREQMALTHYLAQIDNPQLAFSVKQQKPNSLDAAVSTTLEMESYLPQKGGAIGVAGSEVNPESMQSIPIAATGNEPTPGMMKELLDRMKKLETQLQGITQPSHGGDKQQSSHIRQNRRPTITCWRCNRPGHIARDCYTRLPQGNEQPRTN